MCVFNDQRKKVMSQNNESKELLTENYFFLCLRMFSDIGYTKCRKLYNNVASLNLKHVGNLGILFCNENIYLQADIYDLLLNLQQNVKYIYRPAKIYNCLLYFLWK